MRNTFSPPHISHLKYSYCLLGNHQLLYLIGWQLILCILNWPLWNVFCRICISVWAKGYIFQVLQQYLTFRKFATYFVDISFFASAFSNYLSPEIFNHNQYNKRTTTLHDVHLSVSRTPHPHPTLRSLITRPQPERPLRLQPFRKTQLLCQRLCLRLRARARCVLRELRCRSGNICD